MHSQQIQNFLHQGKQTPKRLGQLYVYASASHLEEPVLRDLKESIKMVLVLNEEAFYQLITQASFAWQTKIDRFELLIPRSIMLKRFEKIDKGKEEKITASLRELFIHMISLIFQKLSIQTGKNHLHQKDLALLEELFQKDLAPYEKYFLFSFRNVQKGKWKVTSEVFLFECLFQIQWLADYLEAKLTNHQAKQAMLLDLIAIHKHFSLLELEIFFSPEKQELQSLFLSPTSSRKSSQLLSFVV